MSDPTVNTAPAETAPSSLIAAPSRNALGQIDEPNAAYVGEAEKIVDAVFVQLVNQAANRGEAIDEAALRKQAEDEVAALHVDNRPASVPAAPENPPVPPVPPASSGASGAVSAGPAPAETADKPDV